MWTIIQNNPVGVATCIRLTFAAASTFGFAMTPEQIFAVMAAIESLLMLVTYKVVTPNIRVEDKVDQKVAYREAVTRSRTGGI